MIELLISILMALGLSLDSSDGKLHINQTVLEKAQANSSYKDLGGDNAVYNIATLDSKPLDDVVITSPVDPTCVK